MPLASIGLAAALLVLVALAIYLEHRWQMGSLCIVPPLSDDLKEAAHVTHAKGLLILLRGEAFRHGNEFSRYSGPLSNVSAQVCCPGKVRHSCCAFHCDLRTLSLCSQVAAL